VAYTQAARYESTVLLKRTLAIRQGLLVPGRRERSRPSDFIHPPDNKLAVSLR
jgi:hypothetical protein